MYFSFFVLFVALCLSSIAAYYSIAGLAAIFAAAVFPIILMGSILEVAKITVTVWLHQYWSHVKPAMKIYLVTAVAFLMFITSMGIFGFLSKAHLDQAIPTGDAQAELTLVDEKIKTEKDNIETARRALKQMDEQVDQILGRTTDDKGAERAVQIRRNQSKERSRLQADIADAQKRIASLNIERAPAATKVRKVDAEVGPIKYIAALVYGDNPDANILEKAVRLVIIIIVAVFDPLAVMMVLAATESLGWHRDGVISGSTFFPKRRKEEDNPKEDKPKDWHQEWVPDTEAWPKYEPDDGPLTVPQIDKIKTLAGNIKGKMTSLFEKKEPKVEPVVEPIDDVDTDDSTEDPIIVTDPEEWLEEKDQAAEEQAIENIIKNIQVAEPVPEVETVAVPENYIVEDVPGYVTVEGKQMAIGAFRSLYPGVPVINPEQAREIQSKLVDTNFGSMYPAVAHKGDLFVRTDYVPTKLFKFNGDKWIELDKSSTDSYSYDNSYIDYLIKKIGTGEYDPELLSDAERSQLEQRLKQEKL